MANVRRREGSHFGADECAVNFQHHTEHFNNCWALLQKAWRSMRAFLAERERDGRASRRLQQAREWVDAQSSIKMDYWEV